MILLDLKMPRPNGLEPLRILGAHLQTWVIPAVVPTSSNEPQDRIDGYGLGANSHVRKPVDFAKFADVANQICLYWLMLNEPLHRRT